MWSGLVCFGAGLFVCTFSYTRFGLGTISNPGSGLFPFVAGSFLVVLSLLLLWETLSFRRQKSEEAEGKHAYSRATLVLIFLLFYVLLFEPLGFIFSTFLLVFFLFKVLNLYSLKRAIFWSIIITGAFYFTFQYLLKSNLPAGLLKVIL